MNLYFSSGEFCFFLAIIQSSSPTQQVATLSYTHFHGCAISIYASISCGFLDLLSSFLCARIATSHTPPLKTLFFQGDNNHIHLFIAYPPHGAPHTFCKIFHTEKAGPSVPISSWPYYMFLCGTQPTSRLVVFSDGTISSLFSFPNLSFYQCLLCPRPVLASKGKDGILMVH